ncbi:histidine triad nucleotide-binding protein [Thiotrichales bacterium HSG1]|nr:histidine triad nucleotide-binding protein [Thiotrichales bacterium HSG1]
MSTDCLFCKIITGELPSEQVYSDETVVVFKDINPKAPIHLLIVPREHIISLNELDNDDLTVHMMQLLPKLAKYQGLNGGFRTVINTGPAGGQIVFHLHIHLLGGGNLDGTGFAI